MNATDEHLGKRLFTALGNIYGHLWRSQYGTRDQVDVGIRTWMRAINAENLTPEEIGQAIDYCATREPEKPSLPRFIEIARSFRRLAAHRDFPPALPVPSEELERRRQVGLHHLEELRALFGRGNLSQDS